MLVLFKKPTLDLHQSEFSSETIIVRDSFYLVLLSRQREYSNYTLKLLTKYSRLVVNLFATSRRNIHDVMKMFATSREKIRDVAKIFATCRE